MNPAADAITLARRLADATRHCSQIPAAQWSGPGTLDHAYAVQDLTARQLGLTPCGWKAGSTNSAAQARRGITEPVHGRLFESLIYRPGETVPGDRFIDPYLEVEFAFRIGRDLTPGHGALSRDHVLDGIDAVILAIEIADGRLENWRSCDGPSCVADNVAHGAAVLGAEFDAAWCGKLAQVDTSLLIDAVPVAAGRGAAVLGDPVNAVVWLANALPHHGCFLREGDVVLSGTTTGITPLDAGRTVTARFAGLGELSIDIDRAGSRDHPLKEVSSS